MLGGGGLGNTLESSFSAAELNHGIKSFSGIDWGGYRSSRDLEREYVRQAEAPRPVCPEFQRKPAPAYNPAVTRWCPEYDVPPLLYDDPPNATAPSLPFLELSAK
jgi:hypothetical protein